MKITTSYIFIIYLSITFILIAGVIINRIHPFQILRIDFTQKNDTIKTVDSILQHKLSFKEASYYQAIEENSIK
ncbi:hypothetical protein HZA55_01495 [Candidatus Poribacteria bacterium]|nr:hypothetical protein [Candidatus Poribacteria bacterium]